MLRGTVGVAEVDVAKAGVVAEDVMIGTKLVKDVVIAWIVVVAGGMGISRVPFSETRPLASA